LKGLKPIDNQVVKCFFLTKYKQKKDRILPFCLYFQYFSTHYNKCKVFNVFVNFFLIMEKKLAVNIIIPYLGNRFWF